METCISLSGLISVLLVIVLVLGIAMLIVVVVDIIKSLLDKSD